MADRCEHGMAVDAECSQCTHDQRVLVRQIALMMGRGNARVGLKNLAKIVSDSIAREGTTGCDHSLRRTSTLMLCRSTGNVTCAVCGLAGLNPGPSDGPASSATPVDPK